MKKLLMVAGIMFASTLSFANLEETIRSHYTNTEIGLRSSRYEQEQEMNTYNNYGTYGNENNNKGNDLVRERIINFAQSKLGSPYVWGATGPRTFDCSGFVGYVFRNVANVNLPRVSTEQSQFKPRISSMNMRKGDLVFFETTGKGRISHVGIYMGNEQFIHASSGAKRVTVSSLYSNFYNRTFRWAINPFA